MAHNQFVLRHFFYGDEEEATELYSKAAEGGYPLAMGMLGLRLIIGLGTYPDRDEGVLYIEDALEGGYGDAGAYLAQENITGRHLPRNETAARTYLARAEEVGAGTSLLDETWMMLEQEFGGSLASGARSDDAKSWLPPLPGNGFHRVGNNCVLRDGA